MKRIEPAIIEKWELPSGEFPEFIEIAGTMFQRSVRSQPYEGVIEQYREMVPRDSMHLLVMQDGEFCIDHIDEYNPDMGYPLRHLIVDHPQGVAMVVAGVGTLGVLGSAMVGAIQSRKVKEL